MSKKIDVIEQLICEIEKRTKENDHAIIMFMSGDDGMYTSAVYSRDLSKLVGVLCEMFDEEDRGVDIQNIFMTTIVTYAKHHPEFATLFIEYFNKAIYGLDNEIMQDYGEDDMAN